MTALREFIKVKNHTVSITLPENFNCDEVEVIVMPKQNSLQSTSDVDSLTIQAVETIEEWQNDIEDDVWV